MRKIISFLFSLFVGVFCAAPALADVVHVVYQTAAGGTVATIAETTLETGCDYVTVSAPTLDGYIFTHWSSSESDPIVVRDAWGRALDAARFTLYQDVTLTAHYVATTLDSDGDGIPDGYEFYWYGNLDQNADSDTDGDGLTFAEELAAGTNPLFPDAVASGGVGRSLSGTFLYNPHNYAPVITRSEPEGQLFASTTNYCFAGDLQRSAALSVADGFAYWTIDGVEQRDAFDRALDQVVVNPDTSRIIEVVAHYIEDESERYSLYWYGNTTTAMDSDTDGDGYTFAEEIANGTNPIFPDAAAPGGVGRSLSEIFLYNPHDYAPFVVRSEPEGVLVATATNYVVAGNIQRTDALAVSDGFAYWTIDGVEQRDAFGRALDQAVVTPDTSRILDVVAHYVKSEDARYSLYWYGRDDVSMDSDTDGDGFTFAEEIANGTNPLFPDAAAPGGVGWADGDVVEANLQPFDPATGAVVGEVFEEIFTSPFAGNAATSATFGANVRPVVADVNGDGLFDLVVLYDGGHAVYANGGSDGNPQFTRDDSVSTNGLDLAQGTVASLDGLTLDVAPTGATGVAFGDVDGDGVTDLLVSDDEGRIWFYKGGHAGTRDPTEDDEATLVSLESLSSLTFTLQHKVWAGAHRGFAKGLTIALVDWDGDGDLDCVCGTADGKLMLLVDPQIGRPTNVTATPGVDSVVLTWDPNGNSRVRGYGIYRGASADAFDCIASLWPLPRYHDVPDTVQDYYYRVTSLSRFYRAGNSTPTVYESMPTDAVYVQFRPRVWLNDTSGFTGSNVTVVVSMNNSMGISADGLSMTFAYDADVLEPVRIRTTGLTDELEGVAASVASAGTWRFAAQGGAVATGAGQFLLLDFKIKDVHDVTETRVSFTAATVKALDGRAVALDLPKSATIEISDSNPIVPAIVAVSVADTAVDSETEFALPVTVTTTETLTNFTATLTWDEDLLELRGISGGTQLAASVDADAQERVPPVRIATSGGDVTLTFYVKDPASVATNFAARVSLSDIAAVDCHGFVVSADDAAGTVLIRNANPPVAPTFVMSALDVRAESGQPFVFNVGTESVGDLAETTLTVEWDAAKMTFVGTRETATVETLSANSRRLTFASSGTDNRYHLNFTAARIAGLRESAQVRVTAVSATGANGLAGVLQTPLPVAASVLIVREVGRYDPGDIDGDGRYTDADMEKLTKYIAYLNVLSTGNKYAIAAMVQYRLTGQALKAADVNCDGVVDANDVAMLAKFIAAAKEGN